MFSSTLYLSTYLIFNAMRLELMLVMSCKSPSE